MIYSKLPNVGTTIFTLMSRLAVEHEAINLGQGFPNFNPDPELIALVNKYLRDGFNQYAPMEGVLKLREVISEKIFNSYKVSFHPETEITLTNGAAEALYVAIATVVHPGDEVIVFEPVYDLYVPAIQLNGGVPVYIALEGEAFCIDWEKVAAAITNKTKAIIINNPHNPTGSVLGKEDLRQLAMLVDKHNMFVISDEVYEHIVFDGQVHESVLSYPGLRNRCLAVYSFGKTLHATGWRLGYCIAHETLMKEFRKIHQFITFSANAPMQHAIADYMATNKSYLELSGFFQRKRDKFREMLDAAPFRFLPCKGSYFQVASYKAVSNKKDMDFAIWLTKETGVTVIPLSVFYVNQLDNQLIRFCFAKTDDMLEMAAERLKKL